MIEGQASEVGAPVRLAGEALRAIVKPGSGEHGAVSEPGFAVGRAAHGTQFRTLSCGQESVPASPERSCSWHKRKWCTPGTLAENLSAGPPDYEFARSRKTSRHNMT